MYEKERSPLHGYSELRLVLLGTIGCGKTLSGDTILGAPSLGSSYSHRTCEMRHGLSEGRRLTMVETPRWYWSGGRVEATVRQETVRVLSLTAPGPHAFLLLIPVGQFTEVERRVPSQMEEMFGKGVLGHTIVLFTCGDYLVGKEMEEYLAGEDPGLREVLARCGGRYHVINNRRPHDREQIRTLLAKVEDMVHTNGDCYIQSPALSNTERNWDMLDGRANEEWRQVERTRSARPAVPKTEVRRESWDGWSLTKREGRDREVEETTSISHIANGLHAVAPPRQAREDSLSSSSLQERRPSFRLSADGALLSQLLEERPSQSYVNRVFHRISSTSEEPTPAVSPLSGFVEASISSAPVQVLSTASNFSSMLPELRLVLLGRKGAGKRDVGNCILGQEVFMSWDAALWKCERKTAITAERKLIVVDTPDWLDLERPLETMQKDLSTALSLCSPGPHAFLLCVPVDQPAAMEAQALEVIERVLGPGVLKCHTVLLFTHGERLDSGVSGLEDYISSQREDLLQLVERCGDRYHVMEPRNVGEMLEKVEQAVKESGGRCYSQESCLRGMETGGEETIQQVASPSLQSVREVDEDEGEQMRRMAERHVDRVDGLPSVSSSPSSPSLFHTMSERVIQALKGIPKLLAGGALLGGLAGIYLGGPLGGAVGAAIGTAATEVGRRKYSTFLGVQNLKVSSPNFSPAHPNRK